MSDDPEFEARLDAATSALIEPAGTLYAVQKMNGDKVRRETKEAYGRLKHAHLLITGVLAAALIRINGKIVPATPGSSECNALRAAFIIGMGLCEEAIEQGQYLQASALLRQEMETVAQMKAVRAGARNEKNAPNVGVLEKSLRSLYGPLSAAAHVSKHWIVEAATFLEVSGDDLPDLTEGTRQFPVFDRDVARKLFTLHLMLMMGLIDELSIDLSERHKDDVFTEKDAEALGMAVRLMADEGMVILGDDESIGKA